MNNENQTTSKRVQMSLMGLPPKHDPEIPGLERTDAELVAEQERDAVRRTIEEFLDQEAMCPNCPGDGSNEETVFWNRDKEDFRCTHCGWVHREFTATARKLLTE